MPQRPASVAPRARVFEYLPPAPKRVRASQAEKAAESRRRLLDAAISCLIDRGYSHASTSEIAERAGLSRGSQTYHFPKKEELLTSAMEYLVELMLSQLREHLQQISDNSDRWTALLDRLWKMHEGPLFFAWMELVVASRTDPKLRKALVPVNRRLNQHIEKTFRGVFKPSREGARDFTLMPFLTFFMMFGMAIERTIGDFSRVDEVLETLAKLGRSRSRPV
jgi:AcrR family transcriptional regulator